jgi:hypothetical protein
VPAIGWRKESPTAFASPLFSWLGRWQLDAFAGQLTQRSGPNHPHLLGARLQVMPLSGLELGVSGTLQWGGGGRTESVRSLLRGIIGQDNFDPSQPDGDEAGNGLAGFDARYTVRLGERRTVSIYGQAIGDDEAGYLPSHYLGGAGVDAAFAVGAATARVFFERADTSSRGFYGAPILGSSLLRKAAQRLDEALLQPFMPPLPFCLVAGFKREFRLRLRIHLLQVFIRVPHGNHPSCTKLSAFSNVSA